MDNLNFPSTVGLPNGYVYSQNGLSYRWDGVNGVWTSTAVSYVPNSNSVNTQIVFVDDLNYPNGHPGLVFDKRANTLTVNTIKVNGNVNAGNVNAGNVTASYLYGNGALLSGISTSLVPANNWANSIAAASNSWANTFVSNTSGVVHRGNMNFANGNVSIQTTNGPTALYVQGSAAASMNTLVDDVTIVPQFWQNNNFTVTLTDNRIFDNPANPTIGQSGVIYIVQDSTGSRTLVWGGNWRFQGNVAPTLSTSGGSVDMIVYSVRTTSNISATLINNIG